ncbi:hypothetical protein PpBr36_01311 [Pyricularia pennisetigena]|uniref:hypothetical protein n=1 Tax=Pyricularia pennisetigena TaxID=1578925 RepID=UPI00114EEF01|nr:hypothetical protein PpBr36_01311 [Pyricularia pennisetigena]TLS28356.1 hypothetical protein PpBr36_01311 [Pyricularia pennisetigena]
MACSCRTAALRIFVRGFTQLHIAEKGPGAVASSVWQQQKTVTAPRVTYRNLHYTTACRNNTAAAAAETLPTPENTTGPEQRQQNEDAAGNAASLESASLAELTPEAIDALASEITASRDVSDRQPCQSEQVAKASKKSRTVTPASAEPEARLPRKVRRLLQFGPGDTPPQIEETPQERKKRRLETAKVKAKKDTKSDKQKLKEADGKKQTRGSAEEPKPKKEPWMVQKDALEKKFGDQGWRPQKKLSPDAIQGIRALHKQFPDLYTTPVLAERFEVSPEAIRRILKSNWTPSAEEEEDRQQRWFKRGKQIWEQKAQQGTKPPKKWREEGIKTNWDAKREFVKRKMELRRRDMEEEDLPPPRRFNNRPHQHGPHNRKKSTDQPSQARRRSGGPRRLGGVGGSGRRED